MDINKVTIPLANVDIGPFFWKSSTTSLAYAEIRDNATGKVGIVSNQGMIIAPARFDLVKAHIYGDGETVGFSCACHGIDTEFFDVYGNVAQNPVWVYHGGAMQISTKGNYWLKLHGIEEKFSAFETRGKYLLVRRSDYNWAVLDPGREWTWVVSDVHPAVTTFSRTDHVELLAYRSMVSNLYGGRAKTKTGQFDIVTEFQSLEIFGDYLLLLNRTGNGTLLVDPDRGKIFSFFPEGTDSRPSLMAIRDNGKDTGYIAMDLPEDCTAIGIQTVFGYFTHEASNGKRFCLLSRLGHIVGWSESPIRYCGKVGNKLSFILKTQEQEVLILPDLAL